MGETALDWIDGELAALAAKGLRRSLEPLASAQGPIVMVDGRPMVSLCSNDYLALAADPRLRRAAAEAAEREGAGAGAARLVSGDLPIHGALERRLAAFKGTEAALLFNTGYHANAGVPPALVGRGDAVFCDVLDHASIVDGCLLSRAELVRYRHCDVGELDELLARTKARRKLVVTDSIFGMDGDAAPLRDIAEACERHGAMLYVDEAYVAGSRRLVDLLVSKARTFIFTTALPPAACGAALAALDVLAAEPARRERLRALSARMKAGLEALGFDLSRVVAPIFPVVLGTEERALAASRGLRARGYFVRAIRPPTVPRGTSRLRVALTAGHTEAQVDAFVGALAEVVRELPPPRSTP